MSLKSKINNSGLKYQQMLSRRYMAASLDIPYLIEILLFVICALSFLPKWVDEKNGYYFLLHNLTYTWKPIEEYSVSFVLQLENSTSSNLLAISAHIHFLLQVHCMLIGCLKTYSLKLTRCFTISLLGLSILLLHASNHKFGVYD